ncbi:16S rRNA (cytidine(1402)-2'-O)-methyltransferase [Bacteroidota bacterium]
MDLTKPGQSYELENALYIVPTPIGNLDDITIRALKVLSGADIIACEDTRHTGNLLKKMGIPHKKMESYHEHNESKKTELLISQIKAGKSVALVSDAGSPLISDPGHILVREAVRNNIDIISLPGASAFVPALSACGFPVNEFIFFGFPPQKKGRKTFIENLSKYNQTIVLYESPYRILKLLGELYDIFEDNRKICLAREISKIHEEYIRGSISECLDILNNRDAVKGEFVVVIDSGKT